VQGDRVAEDRRAEKHRDHGQQVRHGRGGGGALVGDQPVVEHVREAGAEDAEDRDAAHHVRPQVHRLQPDERDEHGCQRRRGQKLARRQGQRRDALVGELHAHVHEADPVARRGGQAGQAAPARDRRAGLPRLEDQQRAGEAERQAGHAARREPRLGPYRQRDHHGEQRRGAVQHAGDRRVHRPLADREQGERQHVGERGGQEQPAPDEAVPRQRQPARADQHQQYRGAEEQPQQHHLHGRHPVQGDLDPDEAGSPEQCQDAHPERARPAHGHPSRAANLAHSTDIPAAAPGG